jgi:hypothetical protein
VAPDAVRTFELGQLGQGRLRAPFCFSNCVNTVTGTTVVDTSRWFWKRACLRWQTYVRFVLALFRSCSADERNTWQHHDISRHLEKRL